MNQLSLLSLGHAATRNWDQNVCLQTVDLELVRLEMKSSSSCVKRQLVIHDGDNFKAPLLASVCGHHNVMVLILYYYSVSAMLSHSVTSPVICIVVLQHHSTRGGGMLMSNLRLFDKDMTPLYWVVSCISTLVEEDAAVIRTVMIALIAMITAVVI